MLTHLKFKNWRSLRDVEINDLTPITVFIGANSSGKTNIIDALYFLRESHEEGVLRAIQKRGGMDKVHTIGVQIEQPIEIEIKYSGKEKTLSYLLGAEFDKPQFPIPKVAERLEDEAGNIFLDARYEGGADLYNPTTGGLVSLKDAPFGWEQTLLSSYGKVSLYPEIYETYQFITDRWQLLDENFMPPLSIQTGTSGDLSVIDRCADNVPIMLDFMMKVEPDIYQQLQEDARWLLGHVEKLGIQSDEYETRISLYERILGGREAPTLSAGTARLVTMLTAIYALNYRQRVHSAGLVVIEEPDTALNPGVLRNFVELLRTHVDGEYPRQFILTTHNPRFLDYFEPEEVRVVSRGEDGYTRVDTVPENISDIWGDDHSLGEVWMTNSFGGIAR